MRAWSILTVLAAVAIAAGCSRPHSPVAPLREASSFTATGAPADSYYAELEFRGDMLVLGESFTPRLLRNRRFFVRSSDFDPLTSVFPRDTVPAGAELVKIRWLPAGRKAALGSRAGAVTEPARDTSVVYEPGIHLLYLQAPERAGGGRYAVAFVVGVAPIAWYAGPDPARWPRASDGDWRAVDVLDWRTFATRPAWPPDGRGWFGPDSFRTRPLQRLPLARDPNRRTFYELFGDRLYARSEGDTVHAGAWVVVALGGFDADSRYAPVAPADSPALPPGFASDPLRYAALVPDGLVGSPIGFRLSKSVLAPNGNQVRESESALFPAFDTRSVFFLPRMCGYTKAAIAGKYYLQAVAQDADGVITRRMVDVIGETDLVDAGGGTPEQRAARRQVLTFVVRPAAGAAATR